MSADTNSNRGFTIVEMLFVLAIAGIILILIFMAIPTLERNGRNNQRKQDVASILQAISRWELSHSGAFPLPTEHEFLQNTNLTYYSATDTTQVVIDPRSSNNPGNRAPVTNVESIVILNYAKCNSATGGATAKGAGYDDAVVLYAVETRSGSTPQCQQL